MEPPKALKVRKAKGAIICESVPYLAQDALLLQQTYQGLPQLELLSNFAADRWHSGDITADL